MSTPNWLTLTEDERVVWQSRPSLKPYLMAAVEGIFLVAMGIAAWLFLDSLVAGLVGEFEVFSMSLGAVTGGVLVLLGLLGIGLKLVEWWSHVYVVTSEEVYKKQGLVARTVQNLPHERIQDTAFSQSVPGRLLAYGTVSISTAGTSGANVVFKHVDDPDDVVGAISEHVSR